MASFKWTPPEGSSEITFTLPRALKIPPGNYGRMGTRYRSIGVDQRTTVTEVVANSGADVVEGLLRYVERPALLVKMLQDGADGVLLTYVDDAANEYPSLRLEEAGALTHVSPDSARYGFGEWERTLRLRQVTGETLAGLFPNWTQTALKLPGTTGNYASTPDVPVLNLTGDLDLRAAVALDDWTNQSMLIDKREATVGGYRLLVVSTGELRIVWQDSGGTSNSEDSTTAPTVNDGDLLLVRATLDLDNGAGGYEVQFFTKSGISARDAHRELVSNTGWTQLGSTVTGASTTDLGTTTVDMWLGDQSIGTSVAWSGKYHAAAVLDGINGSEVLAAPFSHIIPGLTKFDERANGLTITINQSGSPAARLELDV